MYSYNYTEHPFKFEKINLKKPNLIKLILIYIAPQFGALFCIYAMISVLTTKPIIIMNLIGAFLLFGFFQSFAFAYLLTLLSYIFKDPSHIEILDRHLFSILPDHIQITKNGLNVLSYFSYNSKFMYDWSRVRSIKFEPGSNSKIIIEVMKHPEEKYRGKQQRKKFSLEQKELSKYEINIEELFNSIKTFKMNAKTRSINRYQTTL